MPAVLILLFLIIPLFSPITSAAQLPTTPFTIKLQSFTPVPTKIPTPTPLPAGTGVEGGECTTEWVKECKKSCNNPGKKCGTGGTGAQKYECRRAVTICAPVIVQPPVGGGPVVPPAVQPTSAPPQNPPATVPAGVQPTSAPGTVCSPSSGALCKNQKIGNVCEATVHQPKCMEIPPNGKDSTGLPVCQCLIGVIPNPTLPPQIIPTVGPPINPPNPATDVNDIYDLVAQIKKSCNGHIYGNVSGTQNLACVSKMSFPKVIDADVKSELYWSAAGNDWLQCVGFVRAGAARHELQAWPRIYGNAIAYASSAIPPGYRFIKNGSGTLQPHDLVVWYSPAYPTVGHIAYVTRVYSSTRFQVAEANYGCGGARGCARLADWSTTATDLRLVGWLRKK